MNIYVGNLAPNTTEESLRKIFETHGEIASLNIIKDRYSGESRGFGFIEMPVLEEAQSAISSLNGTQLDGNTLKVNEARPKRDNRGGGRRGGGRRW
ncbi:MAG: RNA-binding protein [candidate division Zixibacteria bacterium]|nr:RNA-binding protein [candidate division Zixibacteria bacterium]